ncbi:MAG: alpha/beta fold hydrolase, partial [Acidobacteriota bacterium]
MHANVNGIQLYYELHGSGDPVLLIPGLGSDTGTWTSVLPALEGYRAISIENRGSGRSGKPAGPYTTALMAEDAVALLNELGIDRAHVIAKSMGGMIAQMLAAAHPQRVRSLVLACTLMHHDAFGEELLELGRILAEKAGLYETYRLAFLLSYSKEYCMMNRSRLDEAKRLLEKVGSRELLEGYIQQSIACEKHDSREAAKQIKAPTLILAATEDTITTAQHAAELSSAIRGSELVLLPRGKHGFWREYPEDVN